MAWLIATHGAWVRLDQNSQLDIEKLWNRNRSAYMNCTYLSGTAYFDILTMSLITNGTSYTVARVV